MADKLKLDEMCEAIREVVAVRVQEGFDPEDQIIDSVSDYLSGEYDEDEMRPFVERLTADLLAEHQQRQSEWVGPTDCDRLDEAFDALEASGIVARQNFSCCSNCGHSEMQGEIAETEGKVSGYTFYHMQDTESAASGDLLYLAYGATSRTDKGTRRIGERIAAALRRAGLTVEWNGSETQRIGVRVEWRRRRA